MQPCLLVLAQHYDNAVQQVVLIVWSWWSVGFPGGERHVEMSI
jgi:hypothetical protein